MAGIRQSKFKHVFGKALKRDECYECVPITKGTHDSWLCCVNIKYLAIITESAGGGAFAVIPIEKTGRLPTELPLVTGHTAAVLDIKWSPFDDDMIASASEDCTIKIWRIPNGGIPKESLREPLTTLAGHQRRVNLIIWHPTAEHVLVSAGADNMIFVWDIKNPVPLRSVELPNIATSLSFNKNGSRLAVCCKDGLTRIIDPRKGKTLESGTCHEGKKPQQCIFLSDNRVFTTGFSRMSERQLALWDANDLSKCLWKQELDTSNGVLFPFYDPDCQLIYICGKGDSTVRYFEYVPEEGQVYFLSRYDSSDPQRGFAFMPKLGLNTHINEIARLYKLHNKNWCEVIPFTVPRKAALFQDDLYPDTAAPVPALSAEAWIGGQDADPKMVAITADQAASTPASRPLPAFQTNVTPAPQKPNPSTPPSTSRQPSTDNNGSAEVAKLTERMEKMEKKMRKLEERLRKLEELALDSDNSDE
ncbi:Coronin-1C [Sparganum proliferum]